MMMTLRGPILKFNEVNEFKYFIDFNTFNELGLSLCRRIATFNEYNDLIEFKFQLCGPFTRFNECIEFNAFD